MNPTPRNVLPANVLVEEGSHMARWVPITI